LQDFLLFDSAQVFELSSELRQEVALQTSVFDDAAVLDEVEMEFQQIYRLTRASMFCNWQVHSYPNQCEAEIFTPACHASFARIVVPHRSSVV
jgi:hypothetical protein